MNDRIKELVNQARRKPMGDSWTYATPDEFGQQLVRLVVQECADAVFRYDGLTLGQGYTTRKYLKKHFGIEE